MSVTKMLSWEEIGSDIRARHHESAKVEYWIKQGKPAHLSVDFEAEEVHSLPCKDIAAAKKEAQRHADNLKL